MQYPVTEDSVYREEIKILQPVTGYRFAIDSVLLAHFIRTDASQKILEVGAGSGIIAILASALKEFESLVAVEIQPELASLCKTNFDRNRLKNSTIYTVDVKELNHFIAPATFDLIYSNPPYRKIGSGKVNPSTQKAIARHEILMRLSDLFVCADRFLKPDGRLSLILPAYREKDFMNLTRKHEFHLQVRQKVQSFSGEPPAFFLSTITKSPSTVEELPALVIYQEPGKYTPEMTRLLTDPHS